MRTGEIIKGLNTAVSEDDLSLINQYTRRAFCAEEVYTFSVVLCDNEVDRDFERFTVEALFELEKLFVGKTGILDHNPKAENQTARIYRCEVEAVEGRKTSTGDQYFRLKASAYMPRTKGNEELITQIESGICKEVSVGCAAESAVCSVCSAKRGENPCTHRRGETYSGKLCFFELSDITDAYEWSFVAVPAQREAGVIKSFIKGAGKETKDMHNIIKSLTVGDAVTLCAEDAKRLFDYIEECEKKAADGEEYRKSLTDEVLRLSVLTQPQISRKTMENAVKGLSLSEIREFIEALGEKSEKKFTPQCQLAPKEESSKFEENKEFRI